ncbi:fused MFS/spermidine synthase [Elioraea sp. Yellowstone]|jgi:predicted membrane-bound spermidine synthase|uniref:fused MFS/spermidine synthase n=1 Tax=Elioraea sp. Yellowstone TaxID=2592070 RepID=UPI00114E593B|nr:fused MFS/spermidine synthase [Elioraea sp. Yellowstone]
MHGVPGSVVRAAADERAVAWTMGGAFFASGFAALLYQVIWQRMLGLFAGSDAVTAALVVGAFLLGLGLGSLAAGLLADRLAPRRAAAVFAAVELGIAGFALLSRPFLYDLVVERLGPLLTGRWEVFAVCFAGLLVPTFLMGLSLPVLAKAVVARIETAAHRIGLLYGVNTLGAAAGTLAGGFLIVGSIGFEASIRLGAALNALAALAALAIRARLPDDVPAARAAPVAITAAAPGAMGLPAWTLLVFLSGFLIVALEILWVRVLGIVGQGSAYAFPLILGVFLLADGAGLLYGAHWLRRVRDERRAFILLQSWAALAAAATLLGLWLISAWPPFAAVMGIERFRISAEALGWLAAMAVVLIGPPAFLLGMSFPVVQRAVQRDIATVGFRVGIVQLGNIVGNAAGSVVSGLVLLHQLGSAGTAVALAGLAGGMLLWWLVHCTRDGRRDATAFGLAAATAGVIAIFPSNAAWWSRIHGVGDGQQGIVAEDRSGVAVLRLANGAGPMFITGHTQSRVPFWPHHVLLGALGPAIHPDPREVMVIGVGSGGTPYAAGWNPATERVRAIELIQPVYRVIRDYAARHPDSAPAWLARDPRFELAVGDGRREIFVSGRRWDVVEADAILPQTSHSGMLYSVEFLRLVRDSLKPGGLFVQWAPTRRVVESFVSVFPHAVLLRPLSVLIGSTAPIPLDREALLARFASQTFRDWAARARVEPAEFARMLAAPPVVWTPETPRKGGEVNTDLFPRDEYYLNNPVEWPDDPGS